MSLGLSVPLLLQHTLTFPAERLENVQTEASSASLVLHCSLVFSPPVPLNVLGVLGRRTHGHANNANWVSQGVLSSLFPPSAPFLFILECLELLSTPRWVPPCSTALFCQCTFAPDTQFASPVSCTCRSDRVCHFPLLHADAEQQQPAV